MIIFKENFLNTIPNIISTQKTFFNSQKTKSISYRLSVLKHLKKEIQLQEQAIFNALKKDFKKPEFESFISEYGLVISELDLAIKNLKQWAKPKRVRASFLTFPSKDYIYKEPYGIVLVIAPWNYPFLLAINPLIMAIAAGNTVVLKPSELTSNTSKIVSKIIDSVFPKELAIAIEGGVKTATELLAQNWDYIFFTGSVPVGKIVAKAAAINLTPVTLELGGKSPCIIDESSNLKLAAKRISWGKFFNAGQTCIVPDYLIVKSTIKAEFISYLKAEIINRYGETPKQSKDYPRIINTKNTLRLKKMLQDNHIIHGGEIDENTCYIAPTLIDMPNLTSTVMQEEIFGPILPILSYNTTEDINHIISNLEKPLSLYVFSKNKKFIKHIINTYSFGSGCINDTLIQFGNLNLPFGGVGSSGMGNYHGKFGFNTFSHSKSIIKRGNWLDPPMRYAPYKKNFNFIKKVFNWVS